jgi:hypothetical protein
MRESSYARCCIVRTRERASIYSASAVMQRAAHYVCVLIKERPGCDASLLLSENNNTRGAIRFLSLALTTVAHTVRRRRLFNPFSGAHYTAAIPNWNKKRLFGCHKSKQPLCVDVQFSLLHFSFSVERPFLSPRVTYVLQSFQSKKATFSVHTNSKGPINEFRA